MAKRTLEDVLAAALRELETGKPVSAQQAGGTPDGTPWLRLRDRLETSPRLDASTYGRNHGRQRMLAALATPQHTGGLHMIPTLFAMVPKAAMLVIGGLVLTGSAVGASAAVGGPNLPVAALTAIGLHVDVQNSGGIGNAPDAAENGKDHANGKATDGSGNASASATATTTATAAGTAAAGINNAPDAAQNGKDHANERAFLGAGNASVGASATVTAGAGIGIGNAPDAAQVGVDHAAANASLGAGNAPTVLPTPRVGLTDLPAEAQVGIDHATAGAANAEGHRP